MNKKAMFKNLGVNEKAYYIGHIPAHVTRYASSEDIRIIMEGITECYGRPYVRTFTMDDCDDVYPADDHIVGMDVWFIVANYQTFKKKGLNNLIKGARLLLKSYVMR